MIIERGKRDNVGVTRLMYVGDDLQPGSARSPWLFVLGAVAVYWLFVRR